MIPDSTTGYTPSSFAERALIILTAGLLSTAGLFSMSSAHAAGHMTYYTSTGAVTSMDSHGSKLWCGTRFGLVRWDTNTMNYTILRTPDGLPQADIVDIDVASDGTVWVITTEYGIAKFDGTSWKSYSTADGLPYMSGLSIHAAGNRMVYAGVYGPGYMNSGGGLSRFDGEKWTWTRYSSMQLDKENFVKDITSDAKGTVWAVCGGKLASIADSTWKFYDTSAALILFDIGGTLWIHTGNGISYMADGALHNIALPDGFAPSDIVALGASAGGGILALTQYGELLGVTTDGIVTTLAPKETESRFTAMTVDDSGTVWAGLSNGGIARFDNGVWTTYPLRESLLGIAAYRMTIDNEGVPWAVTDNGLFRYFGLAWEQVVTGDKTPDFGNDPDFSLFPDSGNRIWLVGYDNNRTSIQYLADGTMVFDPTLEAHGRVSRAVPDIRNGLWLEFENSQNLFRYENGVLKEIPRPQGVIDGICPLAVDTDGGVWCYTKYEADQFFSRYHNGEWEPHQEVFVSAYESDVTGLVIGQDGSVWVSVTDNHGTTHWPSRSSRILHKQAGAGKFIEIHSLATASILQCIDKAGRLWLSCSGFEDSDYRGTHYYGITRLDGDTAVTMREPQGLPDDQVYDIVADSGNVIWIATAKGIVRYTDETTGVAGHNTSPSSFDPVTAYPNPFNPSTAIGFTLPSMGTTSVAVYSITGQKIRMLVSGKLDAGTHRVIWNGLDDQAIPAASGVYIVRVSAGRYHATGKLTLVR